MRSILQPNIQAFIEAHLRQEVEQLALKGKDFDPLLFKEILAQIAGKQKAEKKLPTWFRTPNIYYPSRLSVEQTSSEVTARYKARLVVGDTLADLTGGLGVDSFYFSKKVRQLDHFEINQTLSQIAAHNFKQLGADNIRCFAESGLEATEDKHYDTIYLDPARRSDRRTKLVKMTDYQPDVTIHLDFLLQRCRRVIVKTSPMLDITDGLRGLQNVSQIHVVAVRNEVKELLWVMEKDAPEISVTAVNLNENREETLTFPWLDRKAASYSLPAKYLYEPHAALMKAGVFGVLCEKFTAHKLHAHSHLFTSNTPIDFPGRRFEIMQIVPYKKKEMRSITVLGQANITTRNFPETVAFLRKKWKLRDGGDTYLFFTTNCEDQRIVLVCRKVV